MRLLDTETGQFVDFPDESKVPAYAILSHTWDSQGEQTYQELRTVRPPPLAREFLPTTAISPLATEEPLPPFSDDPAVSAKVRMACVTARTYGHRYVWIDSCCIDKSSSTELSEAINSMYRWYGKATVCYAFLADVSLDESNAHDTTSQIRKSRWFTRGWTLQELIAPRFVVFLSQEWHVLGSKSSLAALLEEVTGIERAVLTHEKELDAVSVAARMSWASRRSTTRLEDEAYSMLGLFDINMPTLYGEGRRAFARLQEEIVRQIPDQSLFAWGNVYMHSPLTSPPSGHPSDIYASRSIEFAFELDNEAQSLFAPSPLYFQHAGPIHAVPLEIANQGLGLSNGYNNHPIPIPSYTVTPYGMRTDLLLLDAAILQSFHGFLKASPNVGRWFLAILACRHVQRDGELLARVCYMRSTSSQTDPLRGGRVYRRGPKTLRGPESSVPYSVVSLSLHRQESRWRQRTCYIPYLRLGHQEMQTQPSRQRRWAARCTLPEWQKAVLRSQGYVVTTRTIAPLPSFGADLYHLTLSNSSHTITIEYQCRLVLGSGGSDDEVAPSESDPGDAHRGSNSLRWSNTSKLTVWLDAAVVPSSISPHSFEPNGVSQEASGPHEWVDFCAQRFKFPEISLKISQSPLIKDDGRTPSFVKMTRTMRLRVAIEPVAEADPSSCSHHILVELAEGEQQVEELQDSLSGTDSGQRTSMKGKEKGGQSWVAKLGRHFKSQTRPG